MLIKLLLNFCKEITTPVWIYEIQNSREKNKAIMKVVLIYLLTQDNYGRDKLVTVGWPKVVSFGTVRGRHDKLGESSELMILGF